MSFEPKVYNPGTIQELPMAGSTTLTKNKLCKMASGYLTNAASGDDEVQYVALETKTNSGASGAAKCLVLPIDETQQYQALTSTTLVQATHVGNDYDLSDGNTVDLGNTTDKVFHIDSIVSSTQAIGRFNKPAIA